MSRIEKKFTELKQYGEAALIPFITAGDPDLNTTLKIMKALAEAGADCIELGIPFSDPTADGPTIQRSSERALKRPVSLPAIFRLVKRFRASFDVPVVLFGYYNPFFRLGLEKFAREAAHAGADGVLCVDLPPEESAELKHWTDAFGLDLIFCYRRQAMPSESNRWRGRVEVSSTTFQSRVSPEHAALLTISCAPKWRGYAVSRRCR